LEISNCQKGEIWAMARRKVGAEATSVHLGSSKTTRRENAWGLGRDSVGIRNRFQILR